METVVMLGRYKRRPTKYYIGFRGGKLSASTRKRDLDQVQTISVSYNRKYAAFCKAHNHVICFSGYSSFYLRAAEKAADCQEYEFFVKCWKISRKLGEAFLAGDTAAAIKHLRKIGEEKIRKLVESQIACDVLRLLGGLPGFSDVESRFVYCKLKGV